jgi:hypothetical protein
MPRVSFGAVRVRRCASEGGSCGRWLPGVAGLAATAKPVALDPGQTFAIREGGRTVGAGTVTALLD